MDSIILLGKKNTLVEYMILSGADNHPPMLDKDLFDSWKKNGVIRTKKYAELSAAEKIQADYDMKATNIILQGTSLTKQERECKQYDAFDKFTHIMGESLHKYYMRFTQLINDMNIYNMKMEQLQVNTKFLNSLPPEWKLAINALALSDRHPTYHETPSDQYDEDVHDLRSVQTEFPAIAFNDQISFKKNFLMYPRYQYDVSWGMDTAYRLPVMF
ncbi:hypothetical protein Tco_1438971 [Tanacetum coccineum]